MYDFLIAHFSYYVLFFWSILEGEIGLTLGGFLSHEGSLEYIKVFVIAFSGAFIGDMIIFSIGYFSKSKAEMLLSRYQDKVKNIESWFKKYGALVIVFERFLYATHIPSLLIIGASGIHFFKFLLFDILGIFLWSATFTSIGYFFGRDALELLSFVQHHMYVVLILFLFVGIIYKYKK